jgi:hypothetical protein
MPGHFSDQHGTEFWFAELISNQLQLAQRHADFESDGREGNVEERAAFVRQMDALRSKILNQRHQLGILVDGV